MEARRAALASLTIYSALFYIAFLGLTQHEENNELTDPIHIIHVETAEAKFENDVPWTFIGTEDETVEQMIERLALEYGVDSGYAKKISWCESKNDPDAVNTNNRNGSNDMGVFQINSIHKVSDECRLDAECNIRWAMEKMAREGFGAWYSSQSCWDK